MNMIVPAGGNRREWVPSDPDQLVKTASNEDGSEVVEKDDLLEAAMGVLENQKQIEASDKDEDCEKCCEECDCDPCECESKEEKEASKEGDIVEASEEGEATEAGALCGDEHEEIEIVLEDAPVEEVSEEVEVGGDDAVEERRSCRRSF
jgi:hypothetical protein